MCARWLTQHIHIKVVATFLEKIAAHMDTLFIVKVKILVLIKLNSHIWVPLITL